MVVWGSWLIAVLGMLPGEAPSSSDLVARSIAFHDPAGEWHALQVRLALRETRPDGPDRAVTLALDVPGAGFRYEMTTGQDRVEKSFQKGACTAALNGKKDFSEEESSQWRLSCAAIERYFHYYLYLYGLPMKLKDPGTFLSDRAVAEVFLDQEVWSVRVTYAEEVGSDIWYFYFHKETAQLVGCRFFHDEKKGDGEYIQFEGLQQVQNMRLPKNRKWFTNGAAKYLGSDHLEAGERLGTN